MAQVRCHFCDCDLPEPYSTHVIHAVGRLNRNDPEMPDYIVCGRCLKFHKLKMVQLVRKEPANAEG